MSLTSWLMELTSAGKWLDTSQRAEEVGQRPEWDCPRGAGRQLLHDPSHALSIRQPF